MAGGDQEPAPLLGELLGNYRILSKLGQGGMGEVFVGRHEALGHLVAVKVLKVEMSLRTDMVRRFFNEAQAATAIRNLGIAQVFDFGTAPDGRAYFVMELLQGESLNTRLKERRLDYVECCRLGRQTANVLQAAHAAGITHRDLKPDNLFLIPDAEVLGGERIKVLDFGIAKVLFGIAEVAGDSTEVWTHTGLMMGSPHYMSPEQCRGAGRVDARSDIYSLGCILFRMMCGRPPFIGEGPGEILGAHQYLEAPHPHSFAPDMPAGLASLIARMLAKSPDARPQAMSIVSQALDEILQTIEPPRVTAQMAVPSSMAFPVSAPIPLPDASLPPSTMHAAASPYELVSVTFAGAAGTSSLRARRRPILLGGLAVAGAALALVLGLGANGAGPPTVQIASGKTATPTHEAKAIGMAVTSHKAPVVLATVAHVTTQAPAAATPAPAPAAAAHAPAAAAHAPAVAVHAPAIGTALPIAHHAPAAKVVIQNHDVEIECLRYQTDKNWSALHTCADRLRPLNAPLATKLMARATQENQAALRIVGVESALQEKSLKRAKAELDQVWAESSGYRRIKEKYDTAEAAAITALVAGLKRVNRGDCKEYQRVLAQETASQPPRVAAEAQRQVECVVESSPSGCSDTALAREGMDQVAAGQFATALASYEAAYACKPELRYLRRVMVLACNIKDLKKARSIWSKIPVDVKQATISECVRNGITEKQLDIL